jgi:CheY-like chemotaxis protein
MEEAEAPGMATSPSALALHTESAPLHGLRILAADDVDINRDILLGLLSQHGADVHCVEDGKQALNKVKELGAGFYDIVLMDVQMPVMNGLQATELLHMRDATLPIVALTAHALPEERQRCVDAGMLDHLSKPFESDDLVRMVLRHSRRAPVAQPPANASAAPPQAPAENVAMPEPTRTEALTLDLDGALRRCGNQPALLRTLISRFSQEQADFCDRFEAAQRDDPERARQLAHRLKGTAGNLGLPDLAALAGDLEGACHAGHASQVQAVLARLRVVMQQHQAALHAWLDQEPVPA